ncbi:MAG: peptide-methionine (S)-S-oxide reductase MsrA [Spirochaetales bacterium]|nr:peptide-methionine (S)-S-oxide reductase MsrA [Spirochaetales bacterium]
MTQTNYATFGGGCFWCTEAVFKHIDGVIRVVSGYAGGIKKNPTYEEVCSGLTGHAEVIQIEYDPDIITYQALLTLFFKSHDPTSLNRQGADTGTQYRSIILYHSAEQKEMAHEYIEEINNNGLYSKDIVTQVVECKEFFPAEEYHQNYFEKHPDQGYCRIVIAPKLQKLGLLKK